MYPKHNVKAIKKKGGIFGSVSTDMPLGILSLSAYVKQHVQIETKLLDFTVVLNKLDSFEYGDFSSFFREYLSQPEFVDYQPTIIGISALFTPSYESLLELIRLCKQIFGEAIVITGGGVPQNMSEHIFQETPELDAIGYSEGEKSLLALVKAKDKTTYLEESPCWITQSKLKGGPFEHNFIEDLDEIPFYDYGLCDVADYDLNPGHDKRIAIKRNFNVMTSRGCPFKCTFCAQHTVHGRAMRYHSLDRLHDDFKRMKEEFGAKQLVFQDDCLMSDTQRLYEIIKIVGELDLKPIFQNGLNLYKLDWEMLEAMRNVGVENLTLPVESGSQRVLTKLMKKPLKLKHVERVIDDCRALGIYTNASVLIGMPGETKADIEDSRQFLMKSNANWIGILIATPLPGTEMLDVCKENGYIDENYAGMDFKKAVVTTEDFTQGYINDIVYSLNLEINFVNNIDFRAEEYESALIGFENTIGAKSDHAFAYYYGSKCYEKLDNLEKAKQYRNTAMSIFEEQPIWQHYSEKFNLNLEA